MWQIGTDTGLLSRRTPVGTTASPLVLAPGERADVLVDLTGAGSGQTLHLVDVGPGTPPRFATPAEGPEFFGPLVELRVQRRAGFGRTPPTVLRDAPLTSPGTPVRERHLTLVEIMDPDTGEPVMALLNNRPWTTTDIERPTVDTLEVWNLINLTEDSHPIHLHLVQFLLQERRPIDAERYLQDVYGTDELTPDDVGHGDWPFPSADDHVTGPARSPLPSEAGWKDTVQAHPGEVTRIVVPFGAGAGRWRALRPARHPHGGVRLALPRPRPRGQRDDAALRGGTRLTGSRRGCLGAGAGPDGVTADASAPP